MKICSKCGKEKRLKYFHKRSYSKDGHTSQCKECKKIHHSKWYQENKDRLLRLKKERLKRIKEWLIDFKKTLRCEVCDDERWYVLVFHHNDPTKKEECVSDLVIRGWCKESILKEIEKCTVLCANCHTELHFMER